MNGALKTWLVVLAVLLPALLIGLGGRPLYKIQEVRIAETAREMLVSGDYMVPRYNGELRLQKPPLPYWMTAVGYQLAGVNLWAVRLPAAIFGLLGAGLLFAWCRCRIDSSAATMTALILVTSFIGLRYFRSGEADAPLLFFVAAACLAGYEILQGKVHRYMVWAFFASLGLGFATKGPAALAIPLITIFSAAWHERKFANLRSMYSPTGWLILLVLAFSWYGWLLWQLPDAAQHFVGKQVDETFVSGNHAKPFWWYMVHVFDFFAPWSVLLVPAGFWFYRKRSALPPPVRYALIWLAVVFALLMATVNKQMQYALLLAPPLSMLLGYYASRLELAPRWRLLMLVGIGGATLVLTIFSYLQHPQEGVLALLWPLIILGPFVVRWLLQDQHTSLIAVLVAGLTVAVFLYLEKYDKDERKTQVPTVMVQAVTHQPLYQLKPADGAVSYYAGRVVPPVTVEDLPALLDRERVIWVVAGKGQSLNAGQKMMTSGEVALWRVASEP